MNGSRWLVLMSCAGIGWVGCSKEEPTATTAVKPREAPSFSTSTTPTTQSASTSPTGEGAAHLPPGHPPIGGGEMTAAHPPMGEPGESTLQIKMPGEFQSKPARMMTLQVYAAPKVEGDTEDADVSISSLGAKVPLKMNVDRWCSQFELPAGKTCETGVKQETLEGTKYPTTLVEIAGTYKAGSMMGPPGEPKLNYEMVAAEIVTPEKPYYVKMVGPAKTVEHWKKAVVDAIKAAN